MNIVLEVAGIAKQKGLSTTVGGSVNTKTINLFRDSQLLQERVDFIETRKVIMPVEGFLEPNALDTALQFESLLLRDKSTAGNRRQNLPVRETVRY